MSKLKKQLQQSERNEKLLDDVLSGKATIGSAYGSKKKNSQANRKGGATPTEEAEAEMTLEYARFLRLLLPGILVKLSRIDDPRDPSKIRHSLPLLLLFGILMFLSNCTSRRSANREIARNSLLSMIAEFVPGVNSMPHADTLARLLTDMNVNVEDIDRYYEVLITEFIRSDQFNAVNPGRYLVAMDGTRKFTRKYQWDERALHINADDEEKQQHYVYVLEAVLIINNGMTLPLLTEILENKATKKQDESKDSDQLDNSFVLTNKHTDNENKKAELSEQAQKQQCETKAFHRLAERLKKLLGKGCVTLVLDGIYANGPVISRCKGYGWDFMIVLKNDCLKTVWEDFNGLRKIETDHVSQVQYGERWHEYHWSNDLEYIYGNNHQTLNLNLVTCTETWTEERPRSGGKPKMMKTTYAWLSSERLSSNNVSGLCETARLRWRIENHYLVVKRHGYTYSHCYSYDWNAMKGFHYLMKFGRFLNVLAAYSVSISPFVKVEGQRGFIRSIWRILIQGKWPTGNTVDGDLEIRANKRTVRFKFPQLIGKAG